MVEANTVPKHSAFGRLVCHLDTRSSWDVPGMQAKVSSSKMEASNNHNSYCSGVGGTHQHNIFGWHKESRDLNTTIPLVLWIPLL